MDVGSSRVRGRTPSSLILWSTQTGKFPERTLREDRLRSIRVSVLVQFTGEDWHSLRPFMSEKSTRETVGVDLVPKQECLLFLRINYPLTGQDF